MWLATPRTVAMCLKSVAVFDSRGAATNGTIRRYFGSRRNIGTENGSEPAKQSACHTTFVLAASATKCGSPKNIPTRDEFWGCLPHSCEYPSVARWNESRTNRRSRSFPIPPAADMMATLPKRILNFPSPMAETEHIVGASRDLLPVMALP